MAAVRAPQGSGANGLPLERRAPYLFSASVVFVAQTASLQYPQDAILQDCALAGTPEHRQSPADLQSAIRQISNLRYAKQIQSSSSARYLRQVYHTSRSHAPPAPW